jgi:hypothetical protein
MSLGSSVDGGGDDDVLALGTRLQIVAAGSGCGRIRKLPEECLMN